MQVEIEARFLSVDYGRLRRDLRVAGAVQIYAMRAMKRVIIDYPDQRLQSGGPGGHWGFIRVRDEGGIVKLTYKHISKSAARDTHEIEVTVSSYDDAIALFEAIGLEVISEQHTRRELWRLGGCEVTLDEWPWLPPMVEIEGPDEAAVKQVTKSLGLPWVERVVGNAVDAYRQVYPGMSQDDSIRDIPVLTFESMPQWLQERQKR